RNGNDPRLLRKQPGKRDLRRCRLLLLGESADQIDDGLICSSVLGRKARHHIAKIAFIELRIFADLAGEEALPQRAKWYKPDSEFFEGRKYFRFRLSPPQRILALKCRYGLNRMRATDRFHSCFRESEMLHLALMDQVLHSSGDIFDRYIGIDAMLIQQVNPISLEPPQRCIGHLFDVLGATVQASLFAILNLEPELSGDHHLVTKWSQRFAHQFFIYEWTINFSRIEESYAAFDGCSD